MKVTIEDGKPYGGDRINVNGIIFKDKYLVFENFRHSKPIGNVENLRVEDGELVADCSIDDAALYTYGIAFRPLKRIEGSDGGVIEELELISVSVLPTNKTTLIHESKEDLSTLTYDYTIIHGGENKVIDNLADNE